MVTVHRIDTPVDWKAVITALIVVILLGGLPGMSVYAGPADDEGAHRQEEAPHVLFLINEDPYNYEAHRTIPPFAETLRNEYGHEATVLEADGELPALRFPGLEDALAGADVLVIFFRRAALPAEQLEAIKGYLDDGNPLVGVRTANHAFSVRDEEAVPEGYEFWWEFVPDILGAENRGYGPGDKGTNVVVADGAADHPILEGLDSDGWLSAGNVYHSAPLLDDEANVLLTGTIEGEEEPVEPIAWTRMAGSSRVFYTCLGYPDDFDMPEFRTLLVNAIGWAAAAR